MKPVRGFIKELRLLSLLNIRQRRASPPVGIGSISEPVSGSLKFGNDIMSYVIISVEVLAGNIGKDTPAPEDIVLFFIRDSCYKISFGDLFQAYNSGLLHKGRDDSDL